MLFRSVPAIVLSGGYKTRDKNVDVETLRADYLKNHYHQPSDQTNLPMDLAGAADLARINLRILLDVANAPTAPAWKSKDFFLEKFPRAR